MPGILARGIKEGFPKEVMSRGRFVLGRSWTQEEDASKAQVPGWGWACLRNRKLASVIAGAKWVRRVEASEGKGQCGCQGAKGKVLGKGGMWFGEPSLGAE